MSPEPPGNELQAFLWVMAVFIAVLELTWWIFDPDVLHLRRSPQKVPSPANPKAHRT